MSLENIPIITTGLSIGGHDFNPDEITSLVGIEPTKIWRQRREWIKSTLPDINTIEWRYELKEQRKSSLGEAIEEILDVLWSKKDTISGFLLENRLKMHIDCRPFGDASVIVYIIQPEVMRKMAFFGASLSLAIYKCSASVESGRSRRSG
jgi:Domain of unknown function (DUF4279)